MNNEPEIDLEIDDNMNGILIIGCPECRRKSKTKLRNIKQGIEIKCTCGYTVSFADNELRKMQKSFDDLKRALDDFC